MNYLSKNYGQNELSSTYKSTAQALGITGFILGILTLLISFIPCLGVVALVFGMIAIVISVIGLIFSIKYNHSKIFVIIALILALIGSAVAGLQYFVLAKFAKNLPTNYQEEVNYTRDTDTIFSNSDEEDSFYYDQDSVINEKSTE